MRQNQAEDYELQRMVEGQKTKHHFTENSSKNIGSSLSGQNIGNYRIFAEKI